MITVKDLLYDIQTNHKQVSSSCKDEVRVMQSMLNDTSYEVDVYSNAGVTETYCPAKEFRNMQASIVSSVTKISKDESKQLVDKYVVTKADAEVMVGISKEFVNTYLETGRKLPFGGREKSNYSVSLKKIPETTKKYQKKVTSPDGTVEWIPGEKKIPEHNGLKSKSSCPSWVK